jgi:hypothetical protein
MTAITMSNNAIPPAHVTKERRASEIALARIIHSRVPPLARFRQGHEGIFAARHLKRILIRNSFNLVERDRVVAAIVEASGAG